MPAYLPPISRRKFITSTAAFAALAAATPHLLAARTRVDPDSWVLFSDTHIAADPDLVAREVNMKQQLAQAVRSVTDLPKGPGGVIVCGDLAYNMGEIGDYTQFEATVRPLREGRAGLHLMFGNHDNRERFSRALPKARMSGGAPAGRQAGVVSARRVNFFLLDSLEKTNSTPGELGKEQLDWLTRELDARKNKPAIVLAHHNPGANASIPGLRDTDEFLRILRPRRHVKAYIFGHTHQWNVSQDPEGSGLHFINLPPTAYIFKPGAPSGWVLANLRKDGMTLTLNCVGQPHQADGQTITLDWRHA